MPSLTLEQIVSKVDSLPPMPAAVLKLSQLLEQPDVSADDLAQVIRLDPELTTQLLRLCNSAYYGLSRKITTVKEAVAILGFKVLKSLVYAILANRMLNKPVTGYCLPKGALWANAVAGAVHARKLASLFNYPDPETAFTAGILRDIGKIVLEEFVGEQYAELEDYARKQKVDFCTAEHEVLGFSHTDLGYQLADKWKLPEHLCHVIHYNHQPALVPEGTSSEIKKLVGIVHLADAFSLMLGAGLGADGLMYVLDLEALAECGLTIRQPETVETLLSQMVELQGPIREMVDSLSG
jgi:HD-like signal output (HDOD) protein